MSPISWKMQTTKIKIKSTPTHSHPEKEVSMTIVTRQ